MDEALAERQHDAAQGKVSDGGLWVEEGIQNRPEVQLHDGAAHPRRDVPHLLQVLLLGQCLPCSRRQQGERDDDEGYHQFTQGFHCDVSSALLN